jgi:hypothetical protein
MSNLTVENGLGLDIIFSLNFDINNYLFLWCSGYHICLTHRGSPVRTRGF